MTEIDPRLKEQLSAWLDGELPLDEARFLQRRLEHDPALRAQFERWQLASACLRGQAVQPMPHDFPARVQAALGPAAPARARWPWAAGVAAAVLVAALLPGMLATDPMPAPMPGLAASPAPAADVSPQFLPAPESSPVVVAAASAPAWVSATPAPSSPLPSVRDFPLVQDPGGKPWPRSPVMAGERSLQAYLVRHNALAAGDGVGGFMPYVDVVTQDAEGGPAAEDAGE